MNEYEILLIWDEDARVWIAQNDDIPLVLENGSLDLLVKYYPSAAVFFSDAARATMIFGKIRKMITVSRLPPK